MPQDYKYQKGETPDHVDSSGSNASHGDFGFGSDTLTTKHFIALSDSIDASQRKARKSLADKDTTNYNKEVDKGNEMLNRYALNSAKTDSANAVNEIKRVRNDPKGPAAAIGGELTPMKKITKKP